MLLILLEAEIVFGAGGAQLRRREKRLNRGDDIYTQMRTFCERMWGYCHAEAGENKCAVDRRDERA